ncbi:flagellar hook-length control protein FliK [Chitinimonas arctica]|nr:flagellar hook-length control protein FliK [Chitinimonas arctica]
MPTANTSTNALANLAARPVKPSGNLRGEAMDGQLFGDTLKQQIQAHQTTQMARDSKVLRPVAPARPAEPQHEVAKVPDKPAQATPAPASPEQSANAAEGTPDVDVSDPKRGCGKSTANDTKSEKEDTQAADAQAGAAATAAMLLQLQQHVDSALTHAQAAAEGQDDPLLQHAGLAAALLDGQGGSTRERADKAVAELLDDTAARLAGERQDLPALLGGKDERAANALQGGFGLALEQQLQLAEAGTARQQAGVPSLRPEPPRSAGVEQSRSAYAIHQPVGSDGWDRAIGHKVVMMVSNQQQEVEMKLNPPHLGPLEVKLTLDQDKATLTFVAAQAPLREALQASMPRLTEMLAESGIQLTQANVQEHSAQTQGGQGGRGQDERPGGRAVRGRGDEREEVAVQTSTWRSRSTGGLPGNVNLFV